MPPPCLPAILDPAASWRKALVENDRMRTFDIVVVGAGIAGASLGYRLAAERSVAVLEQESQPGVHATGRSAAMFMESYGPPQVRALTRASRAFYESPPPGLADTPLLHPRGALYVAEHGQAGLLDAMQAELEATGSVIERLDAAATLARAPCLRADRLHGGLYERDAMDIDVAALHQGFLRGLRSRGGEVLTGARVTAARRDGDCWIVNDGLRARCVAIAAGAWCDGVASLFGAQRLGLVPRRRSAFTFRAPEGVDASGWPTVAGIDESWYFKPDAGQLLGSPANADDTVPHDVVPEEIDIATGIWRIEQATTLAIRRPTATWAGLRTFAPDGEMVIGWDPAVEGLFWLAGQGGYGIQSAAGASAFAAALLLQQPVPDALAREGVSAAALSPQRFHHA
jgi:D-arginine dehydrogenase